MNYVLLIGRLTKDPAKRTTASGKSVCSFSLAVDRDGKNEENAADFPDCVAWENQADYVSEYLNKGDLIAVQGRLQTRNYEDETGKKVYVTEVVCRKIKFLAKPGAKPRADYPHNGVSKKFTDFAAESAPEKDKKDTDDLPFGGGLWQRFKGKTDM